MRRLLVTLAFLAGVAVPGAFPGSALAQAEIVDRVIAIVGSEIVLLSEVDEELYLASLRGQLELDDEPAVAAYREEVLTALVEAKLLLVMARREGISVTRDEIDQAVDSMVDDVRQRFPDQGSFESQLEREGTSEKELRDGYRARVEEQLIVRQLVDRTVRGRVNVDEREVRRYWDENRDEIPSIPASMDLGIILVSLKNEAVADSAAVQRAQLVKERLDAGEEFGTLAKVFSEGPTADKGGRLGWFSPSDLDERIAEPLLGLTVGDVTPVILTEAGAILVRVDDMNDEEGTFLLSQIVFRRDEESARAQAKARAESIRRRILGGESFEAVATEVSDDPATAEKGGQLGEVPAEAIDPQYRAALDGLEPGDVSDVVEDPEGFVILRLNSKSGEREPSYDEAHDQLLAFLEQQKSKEFYDELVAQARTKTYVEIRLEGPES